MTTSFDSDADKISLFAENRRHIREILASIADVAISMS